MRINKARLLLWSLGGNALLVGGWNGHYWADNQTPKKEPKRPQTGRGNYGAALMAHFDREKFAARKEKRHG